MSEETSVLPGMSVCTFDGRRLGRVAAAEPGRLLVERRWRGAYWMPSGLIRSVTPDCATLHIDRRVVPRYRQPAKAPDARYRSPAGLRLSIVGGLLGGLMLSLATLL
jgi:hypothetical protein